MNHHDIRLIEIGQKEGYAKAVREIVAWLRKEDEYLLSSDNEFKEFLADQIEEDFGADNGQRHKD